MTRTDSEMERSQSQKEGVAETGVAGERGAAIVNNLRSMQSRVSSFLAAGVMIALGLGALSWYYANALGRQRRMHQSAIAAAANNAQGEMALPPLGAVAPPGLTIPTRAGAASEAGMAPEPGIGTAGAPGSNLPMAVSRVHPTPTSISPTAGMYGPDGHVAGALSPAPAFPPDSEHQSWNAASGQVSPSYGDYVPPFASTEPARLPQRQSVSDRRLSGVAFARESLQRPSSTVARSEVDATALLPASGIQNYQGADGIGSEATSDRGDEGLGKFLRPRLTTPSRAQILPTQQFLLPKGAFIDCTLETAIDSTLPGMTTCVTATDTFGVDGRVVLLERGSKLIGETRGQVQNGSSRVFVLWTEARTPTGVVVPLESPGTDELGRSGLPGEVNRHFWDRFGAAILISVIDGAMQAAVQSSTHGGNAIIYNPASAQGALTDVLKGTVNIAPTVTKHQGDRIQILVARDLDFRTVYELRTSEF